MDSNIKIVVISRGFYTGGIAVVKLIKNKLHKLNKKRDIEQNFTEEMKDKLNFFYFMKRHGL